MKSAGFLLLLLLFAPVAGRTEPFVPERELHEGLVIGVTATALAFMVPRTLEPVPMQRLAVWGLHGLTTLDPRLDVTMPNGVLRLTLPNRLLLSRPLPDGGNADAWGRAIGALARAGWDASESVRHAGTAGFIAVFFDELFSHLDPYSRYVSPAEAAAELNRRNGQGGIGATVVDAGAGFAIQSVDEDGPAASAGVRAGERLLAVDGKSLQDVDLATVKLMLSGPPGASVSLTLRAADGHARDVSVTRAVVVPETVFAERNGDMLLLHVTGFASDTGARLGMAIVRGLAGTRPPRGLLLDLRGNRGGLLREAVSAAETLLSEGVVCTTAGRDPDAAHEFRADGKDLSHGVPVVVLVDGRSASAAEVLAAALADHGRAVVVGSSTLGKGLVQSVAPLPDGGAIYLSWSRVLAPLGWPIQGLGVLPQVCTSFGEAGTLRQLQLLDSGEAPMASALMRHRGSRAPLSAAEILEIRSACPAAEGGDLDVTAARFLLDHPSAFGAALLDARPGRIPDPPVAAPRDNPASLTNRPEVRN